MSGDPGHPTILIVYENRDFRDVLVRELQQKGYLVLAGQSAAAAYETVIRHSRHIHLLIADDSEDSRAMAAMLKPYRPDMQVIHISPNLEIAAILVEVSKILDPPPNQKKRRGK